MTIRLLFKFLLRACIAGSVVEQSNSLRMALCVDFERGLISDTARAGK